MAQVLQLGRMAESDALLTLCLAAALVLLALRLRASRTIRGWHGSAATRWPALAGLAKGPQGPVYFVAITTVFLLWRRDWRFLFNRWHLAGLATVRR